MGMAMVMAAAAFLEPVPSTQCCEEHLITRHSVKVPCLMARCAQTPAASCFHRKQGFSPSLSIYYPYTSFAGRETEAQSGEVTLPGLTADKTRVRS